MGGRASGTPRVSSFYFGWYAFCLVAWATLPGDWVEGQQMRNGKKSSYKINGKSHPTTYLGPGAHFFSFIVAFSTYSWACCRHYHQFRPIIIHIHSQPLDRPCHCDSHQLRRSGFCLVRVVLPARSSLSSRWQHREPSL